MHHTHYISTLLLLCLSSLIPFSVRADSLDRCLNQVAARHKGHYIKAERLNIGTRPVYEIETRGGDGGQREFICDAQTGEILDVETEVPSASDPRFKAKIDLKSAVNTALELHPGNVEEIEFEIKKDGLPVYEIDISDEKGMQRKVEIDGRSGKVILDSEEYWQIGEETDENNR